MVRVVERSGAHRLLESDAVSAEFVGGRVNLAFGSECYVQHVHPSRFDTHIVGNPEYIMYRWHGDAIYGHQTWTQRSVQLPEGQEAQALARLPTPARPTVWAIPLGDATRSHSLTGRTVWFPVVYKGGTSWLRHAHAGAGERLG